MVETEILSKMFRKALLLNMVSLTCLLGIEMYLSSRQRIHERRQRLSNCLKIVMELDEQISKGKACKEEQIASRKVLRWGLMWLKLRERREEQKMRSGCNGGGGRSHRTS